MWNQLKNLLLSQPNNTATKQPITPAQMAARLAELDVMGKENEYSGKRFYYKLRNFWGILLATVLTASIVFQFWLTYQIGTGNLRFQGYETFLGIVAGESFIQVVGLSLVIVKYLFPSDNK